MQATEFEQQMRTLVRRRPFFPFVLEMIDGERMVIDNPRALAFDGPAGAFIKPDGEPVFFGCEQVTEIIDPSN